MISTYILKVILKKSKPVSWYQLTVPSGITFSALSLLLDIASDEPAGDFEFEVYDQGVRLRENIFEDKSRMTWQFSLREADTTFIDDYLAKGNWLTYRPDIAGETAYRVELFQMLPDQSRRIEIVKMSKAARIAYGDDEQRFNRQMKKLLSYKADYNGAFVFTKKKDLPQALEETCVEQKLLPARKRPVSKKDNMITSGGETLKKTAELVKAVGLLNAFKTENQRSLREALFYSYDLDYLIRLSKYLKARPKKIGQGFDSSGLDQDIKDKLMAFTRSWGCADRLLQPEFMSDQMLTVNDQQLEVFERAIKAGGEIQAKSFNDTDAMLTFCELEYAFRTNQDDTYIVPDDVIRVYQTISTPEFQTRRKQHVWLIDCLDIVEYYYGSIPIPQFYRLYSQFGTLSQKEMIEAIQKLDSNETDCVVHDGRIIYENWLKDDEYKKLERYLADKPFYIPDKAEVEDLAWNGYPTRQPEVRELRSLLKKTFKLDEIDTEDLTEEIWYAFNQGENIHDVMDMFEEKDLVFPSEKAFSRFADKIMALNNSTHMLYNRGFTPVALRNQMGNRISQQGLTLVPGSSMAADMLREGADRLKAMGVKVDLDSGADEIDTMVISPDRKTMIPGKKKIYPNDPCPCGSGKKYKKCCGLKKG